MDEYIKKLEEENKLLCAENHFLLVTKSRIREALKRAVGILENTVISNSKEKYDLTPQEQEEKSNINIKNFRKTIADQNQIWGYEDEFIEFIDNLEKGIQATYNYAPVP